jgi:hypothetical protein
MIRPLNGQLAHLRICQGVAPCWGPPAAETREDPSTFGSLDQRHVGNVASKSVESCGIIDQDSAAQDRVRNPRRQ